MFHSRSGQTMSASAQGSQAGKSDIELQEVAPFAGAAAETPPPQTRPFTGVLDQHHCLLSQPQGGPCFPPSSEIPRHFAPDSASSRKPHSSSFHHSGRGHESTTQNPQHRHSSGSQKLHQSGRPPPPPYTTADMTEARREQSNGVPVTSGSGAENHALKTKDGRTDRDVVSVIPVRKETELPPPSNKSGSGESAESAKFKPPVSKYSTAEENNDRPGQASGFSGANSVNKERTNRVQGKAGSNYDHLYPGPSTSQHLYRPIVDKADITPEKGITAPNPSKSSRPLQGARSPLYDSANVCTKQVRSEAHPFLPSKPNQRADHPDDIIELQGDVNTGASREEKQNKSNTQKDAPQVTEIPNTNFAIACMVALCFNLPFGVLAMYFSLRAVKAYQDGRAKLGERRSRWSIVLSLLGIAITTVIISSVVLYTAMQGQKRIGRHKIYGTRSGLNL